MALPVSPPLDPANGSAPSPGLVHSFAQPVIRRVAPAQPLRWLRLGCQDMFDNPAISVLQGLFFAAAGLLILRLAASSPHLFTAAISGFLLIGPLLAAGLYETNRRRERGLPRRLGDAAGAWRRNGSSLAFFALLLALSVLAWERISAIVFALSYGGTAPDLRAFHADVFLSGHYVALVLAWVVTGGLLAAVVYAVSVVAAPMLVDREVDAVTAMVTSVKAVARNPLPMAIWALVIVALTAFGFATMLFGMVFVLPLLGFASWHAYRDLVE